MGRPKRMRLAAIIVILCTVIPSLGVVHAQLFVANVVGTGKLVAWLSGLDFEASIEGEIRLTGQLALGDEVVDFSAEGTARGFGVRGITTLISEGWIGFATEGRSAGDEPIEIRGLVHARRKSLIPLQAGDVFIGVQHVVLVFRGETHSFCGGFSGAVEGALEPPETPGTIQLGGTAAIHLEGEPGGFPESIPLDHPALPGDFLQYLTKLELRNQKAVEHPN